MPSMYSLSIPAFIHSLEALSTILTKAEEYAPTKKIDLSVFVNARLAPDMLPLSRQIQIASDGVKGAAARLSGVPIPSFDDNETTFEELKERIAKTVAFLKTVKPEQMDGSDTRTIELKVGGNELSFTGLQYLTHFAIPNLYFHVTTAYDILRHNGVPLSKADYLGKK